MTATPDPEIFTPRMRELTQALNSRFQNLRPNPIQLRALADEFALTLGHVGVGSSLVHLGDRVIALQPDHDGLIVAVVLREGLPGYTLYEYSLFVLDGNPNAA